jgi:hypothetical protein
MEGSAQQDDFTMFFPTTIQLCAFVVLSSYCLLGICEFNIIHVPRSKMILQLLE